MAKKSKANGKSKARKAKVTVAYKRPAIWSKPNGDSRYLRIDFPVPPGKVHSKGGGLTEKTLALAAKYRKRNPKVFTYRRLALAFGTTATNVLRQLREL